MKRSTVDLGANLTGAGAKYQYVHTRTFDELKQTGLTNAIVSTVEQYAPKDLIGLKENRASAKAAAAKGKK